MCVVDLRVLARVVVVEDDVNNLVFLENKRLSVSAVNADVGRIGTSAHYSVKRGDLW